MSKESKSRLSRKLIIGLAVLTLSLGFATVYEYIGFSVDQEDSLTDEIINRCQSQIDNLGATKFPAYSEKEFCSLNRKNLGANTDLYEKYCK